ncbi:hypothetical protein [Lentzea sp. CC55]|uniref:hypothetical protein n=1 Tax=Lentzea sp. CC55 TaxID=2884909 RepID=UPI001F41A60C|nr:hypothetical protein [Lentzea sp. CC55]MCG8924848.1 hypothetical protein [Lentzea sp. CC55]
MPRVRYEATELDNSEAATLARAAIEAEEGLAATMPEVDAASRGLTDATARWRTALDRLGALLADRTVLNSGVARHRAARRHAQEGPEDRRHRPKMWSWVLYLSLAVASVYDTWFFAFMLRKLTNEKDPLLAKLSYLPGLLIAVALLVSGTMLAKQVVRAWSHRDRMTERPPFVLKDALKRLWDWRPESRTRGADDLPWPIWGLPLAFFTFILVTFGVWAIQRVAESRVGSAAVKYPPYAVVMLFLLFTLGAIFVKIIEYNPWADSIARAEKEFKRGKASFDELVVEAEAAKRAHDPAWQRLRTTIENAENAARRTINQAWVCILERRAEHGLAGHLAPSFNEAGGTGTVSLFRDMPEPAVPTIGLAKPREMLTAYDGEELKKEQEQLVKELIKQLEPPDDERSAPEAHEPVPPSAEPDEALNGSTTAQG